MFTTAFCPGRAVKVITVVVCVMLVAIPVFVFAFAGIVDGLICLVVIAIPAIVLGVSYAYTPKILEADDREIRIVMRRDEPLVIPFYSVLSARELSRREMRWTWRTGGNGGFGGYTGCFYNKSLGSFSMYATEMRNLVLIETAARKIVISCRRAEEFVAVVNERIEL